MYLHISHESRGYQIGFFLRGFVVKFVAGTQPVKPPANQQLRFCVAGHHPRKALGINDVCHGNSAA
jgi:hypothetical protein